MKSIRLFMAILFSIALAACGSSSTLATYGISGTVTVTSSGAALAGATITLTGGTIATTDASGNYSFTGLANGSYTVTPTKAGNAFSPSSLAVSVSGANVTGTNFAATPAPITYSISGSVSGATDVTLTLSGDNTGSVVAGSDGVYTLSGLLPGSYTVTPSLSGFTFSPTSTSVILGTANSAANNFVATAIPVLHSLSGAVSGDTLSDVTITVTGTATASATTDSSGNYSVPDVYDGSYTITPSKTDYTFTPSSLAVTVSGAPVTGKNFVARRNEEPTYSISGAVSGAVQSAVTVTLSGAGSASTTTNASGNYTFAGLVNGSYTVTPSKTGYTFAPSSSAATVSGANITGKNFVATAVPGTYTASGTYDWNSTTSVITLNVTSSNFTCNGPDLGTTTITGVTITSTTMTWPDNMTWSRSSGTANDIVGTWTASDSTTGNSYTGTFNANGTVSVVGVIVSCGGGGQNPSAQTQHWSSGYYVSLGYDDSPKTATSVSVTGPGITGSKALTYNNGSWTSPSTKVDLGTTYPAGLPFTYTFSITDTTTWTATATVSCFQERFATNLSPTGTVTGTPTFSWTGIGDSSAIYRVELNDSNHNRLWDSQDISGTSIVYGGPALTSGATYNYDVLVSSSSACSNQSSFANGSFAHQ